MWTQTAHDKEVKAVKPLNEDISGDVRANVSHPSFIFFGIFHYWDLGGTLKVSTTNLALPAIVIQPIQNT